MTITNDKLDELEALAKKVIGLAYNSQDPQAIDDYYDTMSPDVVVALIERIRELENDLMREIGARCDTQWKLRQASAALNKEQP